MLTDTMTPCVLIFLCLFVPFPPIFAKPSSREELALVQNERTILWEVASKINDTEVQMHAAPLQSPDTAKRTELMSHGGHTLTRHQYQRRLPKVHGILILIGWGTLLPIGVIVARNCRKFPLNCTVWYPCHIVCQTMGYILGTIGWCVGILLGSSSKHYVSKTQRTLSIISFTFINVQMLSIFFMRPNKEMGYCKGWNIWHHVLGYAIIGIVIASIFEGINNQKQAEKLKWAYVVILGVLALVAIALEIFRCVYKISHQFLHFTGR